MTQRILIAEDHPQLAASLLQLLAARGYRAEHVTDGVAALRTLAAAPPDLLILDLKLPGLHGIELLKKLRQSPRTASLPVIIVSGAYKGESCREAAAALGVRHYLEKPFRALDLMNAITSAMPGAAPASGASPRPFSQHLRDAFLRNFSGQLLLTWPDARRMLAFANGAPTALRPGFAHRDFGDYLRTRGAISAQEYAYFSGPGHFRHDVLVQMGCLTYPELLNAKFAYLDSELALAFGAPPAQAAWQVQPLPELVQLVTLNVPQLFYNGYRRYPGRAADQLLATCRDKYPTPAGSYYKYINFLSLDTEARQFLGRLDGRRTLAECSGEPAGFVPLLLTLAVLDMVRFADQPGVPASPGELPLRILFNAPEAEAAVVPDVPLESFADLGEADAAAVERVAAAAPAAPAAPAAAAEDLAQRVRLLAKSLEGKNHYEVFGIKPAKFTIELLKERYFAITREYGPDTLMQLSGGDAELVEAILATVANAYNTLSDVIKKERYDELLGADRIGLGQKGDDRFQAQVQAESGKVFIEMEEWENAEKALQEAVNFDPGNGDHLAHLGWAIYRNPKNAASRAMQEKARQLIGRALTIERTPQGFAFRGWMLLEGGQDAMAEGEFNKALKLDARSLLARRGLRVLQEKKEQQKKGLFGRMFK